MTTTRQAIVCDDDPLVVAVASSVLRGGGFDVVATAASGAELAAALRSFSPDVLVLDQVLPDSSGEALVAQVNSVAPACRIILFSGRADTDGVRDDGVFARVAKRGTDELTAAVRRAASDLS